EALVFFGFRTSDFGFAADLWQSAGAGVNALVEGTAAHRICAFNKHALDEFVIKQSLTINELVQHPCGNLLRLGLASLTPSPSPIRWERVAGGRVRATWVSCDGFGRSRRNRGRLCCDFS